MQHSELMAFRITPALAAVIAQLASEDGVSKSEAIRRAVEKARVQ